MESFFEDIIANHCLSHETEYDFIFTPQFTNIGHLEYDVYYEHDCINSIESPSQKFTFNEIEFKRPVTIWNKRSK